MSILLFWIFGVLSILFAIMAVSSKNIVRGGVSLLFSFIFLAAVYMVMKAEFIAIIQVIVYGGAILVLYLFAILMLELKDFEKEKLSKTAIFVGVVLASFITACIVITGSSGKYSFGTLQKITGAFEIGKAMFTRFLLPFELISLLLLVATIGAIAIGRRENQ